MLHHNPHPPQDDTATSEHVTTDLDKHPVRPASSPSSPSLQVAESNIFFPSEPDVCSQSSSVYDNVLSHEEFQARTLGPQQQATFSSVRSDGSFDPNLPQELRPLAAEGQTDQTPQLVQDALQSLPRLPNIQQQQQQQHQQYLQQKQELYPVFQSHNKPPQKPFKIHPLAQPPQQHSYHQLPQQHAFQASNPQHNQLFQLDPSHSAHHSPEQHRGVSSSPKHITFPPQSPYHQSRHSSPIPLLEAKQQELQQEGDILVHQDPGASQSAFPAASLDASYAIINPDNHSHASHICLLVPGEKS